jgi:hydroxymethylbilane synthase
MNNIVIGTRGSKLAIYQSKLVLEKLHKLFPDLKISLKIIKTKGDILLDANLSKVLDKGFFTSEIQDALYNQDIDLTLARRVK